MKICFRTGFLTFLWICALFSVAWAEDFVINDFTSHITVHKVSSFTVTETIDVEFLKPRHGLYREIPYIYKDAAGKKMTTPTEVLSVKDGSGKKIKYKTTLKGNIVNIRMGDPDKYVTGLQTYEIAYNVENAILFFDDHDELYWNVTGNHWEVPIKKASCTVSLGAVKKTREFRSSCYTGAAGSRESACKAAPSEDFVEFVATRSLSPGEGLTIACGWDKGIVSPPSAAETFLRTINLRQNWVFIIPLLSLVIMANLWYTRGRDPRVRESVTVMYAPPKYGDRTLTPAEVGSLLDEKLDPGDVSATIVGLAVKGYIKIEETKEKGIIFDTKDHYLQKVKEPGNTLSSFEQELMSDLFGELPGVQVSSLKNSFYKKIETLKTAVFGELVDMKYFGVSPEKVRQKYVIAAFVTGVFFILVLKYLFGDSIGQERAVVAGFLAGLPVFSFSKYMPAKTRTGSSAYMNILGFKEFLSRAEKDQLERMKDAGLFSKFLPYALALGVADHWAKAFEGIYQQQPDWYISSGGPGTFSPPDFSDSLDSAVSGLSTAMFTSPGGSGLGGGGSSGGGSGGGGGGSW